MKFVGRILGEAMMPKQRAIYKDLGKAYAWARTYNTKFPQAEPYIAKGPLSAYQYAYHLIGGPWPEGEPAIATSPVVAYYYAKNLIKGRWPAGEPAIAKDPERAYQYAKYVVKSRCLECETTLASSDSYWKEAYLKAFPDAKDDWIVAGWIDWF